MRSVTAHQTRVLDLALRCGRASHKWYSPTAFFLALGGAHSGARQRWGCGRQLRARTLLLQRASQLEQAAWSPAGSLGFTEPQ